MNIRTRSILPALGLLMALPLSAQEEVIPAQPGPTGPVTFSFQFTGKTLEQYCDALRELADGSASIVAPVRAKDVPLPDMKLTKVTVRTALSAIMQLAEPEWRIGFDIAEDGTSQPVYSVLLSNNKDNMHQQMAVQTGSANAAVQSQVLSIADLIRTPVGLEGSEGVALKAESVLTAIENGLSMAPPGDYDRRVVFHQETGLVFVRANRDELRLAEMTVRTLAQDLDTHRSQVRNQRMAEEARARNESRNRANRPAGATEPAANEDPPVRRR